MEINNNSIELSRRAEAVIDRLSDAERGRVFHGIEAVLTSGLKGPRLAKLNGVENTYIIRVGQELRVIFQIINNTVRITDIATREKLKQLARKNNQEGV